MLGGGGLVTKRVLWFPFTHSLHIYIHVNGGRVNPQIWKLIFKAGGRKNIGGSRKSINEEAGVAEIPLQRSGWDIYIYLGGRIGCSRCLRVSGEFFDRSGFGADRAAEQGLSGAERLCFGKRINEASNGTPFENWRD